ncbi:hypothetical protein [Micavibrio aeruginosavorus]|uniref:Uncharacterized protein n=1 Tax=Micavibrio aeruginosavorus (strain ARL-13) TaxID=856793 RepID=G2KQ15_MICAA|nr:hypothetical protein [Micavibrio aeruginosavorus]AEP10383.1 putative uncharacterized protein [Micavibrio aeruginosavorus ARL-13]
MDNEKTEEVTLKQICKEKKLDPRLSRMLLREAAKDAKKYPNISKGRAVRAPWAWAKGSKGLDEALAVLKPVESQKTAS